MFYNSPVCFIFFLPLFIFKFVFHSPRLGEVYLHQSCLPFFGWGFLKFQLFHWDFQTVDLAFLAPTSLMVHNNSSNFFSSLNNFHFAADHSTSWPHCSMKKVLFCTRNPHEQTRKPSLAFATTWHFLKEKLTFHWTLGRDTEAQKLKVWLGK